MSTTIELEGIQKSFGKKSVLRGISGTIDEGKVVGLLGRNGEGKTTLFRIMLDILAADGGRVSILDMSPDRSSRIRLKVGYVPERPSFHEFMTVQQVLNFRENLFPTWNREKAERMAKELELDLTTGMKGASKGTLAKTAWICATAHNPAVLLLDEPTSGLDALVRDSLLTHLVGELAEEGKTIFVANHHMEELSNVLDEVWVLSGGRIRNSYAMDQMRQGACRITGRLKQADAVIPDLPIVEEHRSGGLVRWPTVDASAVRRIREMAILDSMETEALPAETAFKLLLGKSGGIL